MTGNNISLQNSQQATRETRKSKTELDCFSSFLGSCEIVQKHKTNQNNLKFTA